MMSCNKIMIINTSLSLKIKGIYKTSFSVQTPFFELFDTFITEQINESLDVVICVPVNAVEQYKRACDLADCSNLRKNLKI